MLRLIIAIAILVLIVAIIGLCAFIVAGRCDAADEHAAQLPPRRSAIPDQRFTDVPLRFAERDEGGR